MFIKNNYWVLRDEVESLGFQRLKATFHLNSRVAPLHSKDNTVRIVSENGHSATLQMAAFSGNGVWTREDGWVSECYGEKKEAPVFAFTVLANGSEELVTFLLPEIAGHKPRVREIEALSGRAFEIDVEGRHDVLLLRSSGQARVETARFVSDFDVTWARFDRAALDEIIVINGRMLEFEGRMLLKSEERITHRFIRMNAEHVRD